MVKILSQAGISLADMYDIEGSIAGIEQLETRELAIVHEMGATLFSERMRTSVRRLTSPATLQNTNIDVGFSNFPDGPTRLLGIQVISDNGARISHLQCSVNAPFNGRDFPVWVYDQTNFRAIDIEDDGGVVGANLLIPEPAVALPSFCGGMGQPHPMVSNFVMRGRTTAFGAGTVTATALIYIAFALQTSQISAFGARIPSW